MTTTTTDLIEFDPASLRDTARKLRSTADNLEAGTTADFAAVKAKALAAATVNTVGGGPSPIVAPFYRTLDEGVDAIQGKVADLIHNLRSSATILEGYANTAETADNASASQYTTSPGSGNVPEQGIKVSDVGHRVNGVLVDTPAQAASKDQLERAARGEIRIVSE